MRLFSLLGLVFVLLLAAAQLLIQLPNLPPRVASHFGPDGKPDGFMPRATYAWFLLAMNIGMPIFLASLGRVIRYLPVSMINLPNKEYWLAGERREQTLAESEHMMLWMASATGLFLIGIAQLAYQANMHGDRLTTVPFAVLMILYLGFVFGYCIYVYRRYRLPK